MNAPEADRYPSLRPGTWGSLPVQSTSLHAGQASVATGYVIASHVERAMSISSPKQPNATQIGNSSPCDHSKAAAG